jgi:PfaD family protein
LIHSPNEEALEAGAVKLYLEKGVRVVEASAFLNLTKYIVWYRAAGLSLDGDGKIQIANKVIAKISRKEVATHFMQPATERFLKMLVEEGKITPLQAELAQQIPMADDITVEADSGGHTDNRPLVALLPSIVRLRDEIQAKYQYTQPIRIGAAGGISTPESALGAFMMGAAFVVTGSVNQACVEAGTSAHVRELLAKVASTDVIMAPASDMFEMGVELQVLKRGTMFGPRAKKLYEYYTRYNSIDEIPTAEREKLEKQVFKKPLEEIWQSCIDFFQGRDPEQITRAEGNPKRKMALIFRWYLGLSSNWANAGTPDRTLDYQIWCGPSMGSFNDWVKGTYLEVADNRKAAEVAERIMQGAAYLYRVQALRMQGVVLPLELRELAVTNGAKVKKEGLLVG